MNFEYDIQYDTTLPGQERRGIAAHRCLVNKERFCIKSAVAVTAGSTSSLKHVIYRARKSMFKNVL